MSRLDITRLISAPTQPKTRRLRLLLFMRDVALLSLTCIGGPQAHIAAFNRLLVQRRQYIRSEELLELHALCQMLPGPTSTQTITAIAFRMGGANLAYLALAVWVLPSVLVMTLVAFFISDIEARHLSTDFTRFVQPVAVGLVAQAAISFAQKTILGNVDFILMAAAAWITYYYPSPYLAPVLLVIGGLFTAIRFRTRQLWQDKEPMRIEWANFWLWVGVFIGAAVLGRVTMGETVGLPIRVFENFYRNGSLIFGGGQVLVPLLFNEFVEFKHYLTQQEFLFGYALTQTLPGPVFAFCSYLGVLIGRPYGTGVQLATGLAATAGIFLPGVFLIFFIIRFWAQLKRYRVVKASLEGINAVSSGLIFAAALLMFKPMETSDVNIVLIVGTMMLLQFTRVPGYVPILLALGVGAVVG